MIPAWVRGNMKKLTSGNVATGRKDMGSLFHGVRGYADGGEVLKQEGLKASAGEKVGFFERLKMGNIDDVNSKAYAQFGAGRGVAERNRDAPTYDQTDDAKYLMPKANAFAVTDDQRKKAEADTEVSPMEKVEVRPAPAQPKAETKPTTKRVATTTKATPSKASTGGQSDTGAQEGASKSTTTARDTRREGSSSRNNVVRGGGGRAGSARAPGFFESLMESAKNPDNPRLRRERAELARAAKD